MQHYSNNLNYKKQSGITLFMSLIVLILIILISTVAITSSKTQYKMAANVQFEDAAMNNAETATNAAEFSLGTDWNAAGFTTYSSSTAEYHPIGHLTSDPLTMTWDDSNSTEVADSNQRYLVEQLSTNNILLGSSQATGGRSNSNCNKVNIYRITARGASVSRGAVKFVQSIYSVLSC